MNRNLVRALFIGIVLVAVGTVSAYAGTYTFDFNGKTDNSGGLVGNATSSQISTYMNSVMPGSSPTVTVTGAKEANGYTADNRVTGVWSGSTFTPKTLGGDDAVASGYTDRFIINDTANASDAIKMSFTGLAIQSISFDLEIFPDGTCADKAHCPTLPDFTLKVGPDSSNLTTLGAWQGCFPGTAGCTGYLHSKTSGSVANETAAQFITKHVTFNFTTSGVDTVWFQDWPATIGIDNLCVSSDMYGCGGTPAVPEPASILLMGSGLLAVVRRKLKRS